MISFLELLEAAAVFCVLMTVHHLARRQPVKGWAMASAVFVVCSAALELYLRLYP